MTLCPDLAEQSCHTLFVCGPLTPAPASQPAGSTATVHSRMQAQWRAAERNRLCCGTSVSKGDRHVVIVAAGWQVR